MENLKVLKLRNFSTDEIEAGIWSQFAINNPKVVNLKLDMQINLEFLKSTVKNFKNLENLDIAYPNHRETVELDPRFYKIIGENAKNLKSLKFFYSGTEASEFF